MKRAWKTLTVAVVLLAGAGLAQAKTPGCMDDNRPHQAGGYMKKMAKDLGLSATQTAQVKDLFTRNRDQVKPLTDKLLVERKALHALIHADVIDEAAIRAQVAKVAAVQADLVVNRAQVVQKIRAFLTPEQVQKFKGLSDKLRSRMEHRQGKGAPVEPK